MDKIKKAVAAVEVAAAWLSAHPAINLAIDVTLIVLLIAALIKV
jgi:hypothetical protein